ncbi:M28 family metallopeptidase [Photobacterium lipolyticum]|uniref:Zn-dependent exopeptidase M28 n=1 Tax=Photobacterium lipolyticum TaxID=266810 RepID=A0A2T3N0I2_9GAMM|nr:M20/M25/M40 family metallo-hydrolase [Photobacterium lipolyticum]PSW05772.1 Zn-dependent exopeptidase M28 [Photobacterium lipolyticum]
MKKVSIISTFAVAITVGLSGCNNSEDDVNTVGQSGDNSSVASIDYGKKAMEYLVEVTDETQGIGQRQTTTQREIEAGNWIYNKLAGFGYDVTVQPFSYKPRGKDEIAYSNNYIVEKKGKTDKTIVLAAHYDSTGSQTGSLGATDNGSGVVSLIAIAEKIQEVDTPYNVRFVLVGAEENGVNGSLHYVKDAYANGKLDNVIAMINEDTVNGGDYVYVHSAHSDYSHFKDSCEKIGFSDKTYSADPVFRKAVLQASIDVLGEKGAFNIHPEVLTSEGEVDYPEGETGSWSDHAGFACAGIPIANVESTNYNINGKWGYDGYSQTTHPDTWDCYDEATKTACNRETETKWGKIWHMEFDRIDKLEELFPGRIEKQLSDNVHVMIELLTNKKYFNAE